MADFQARSKEIQRKRQVARQAQLALKASEQDKQRQRAIEHFKCEKEYQRLKEAKRARQIAENGAAQVRAKEKQQQLQIKQRSDAQRAEQEAGQRAAQRAQEQANQALLDRYQVLKSQQLQEAFIAAAEANAIDEQKRKNEYQAAQAQRERDRDIELARLETESKNTASYLLMQRREAALAEKIRQEDLKLEAETLAQEKDEWLRRFYDPDETDLDENEAWEAHLAQTQE